MAFTEEQKQAIHDDLYNSLKGYASVQDINYAASRIIEDPSPENLDKVREGLISVASPTTSGIVTPDNQIKNIVKNELIYLQSDTEEQTVSFIKENKIPEVAQTFIFGQWNLDPEKAGPEPMEWIMIKWDKVNNRGLCYARQSVDMIKYQNNGVWQGSNAQTWCNAFYDGCFSEEEKQHILITNLTDVGQADPAKVFFLSQTEANEALANEALVSFMDTNNTKNRSKYVQAQSNSYDNKHLLRDKQAGINGYVRAIVGTSVNSTAASLAGAARPAMYISLDYFREKED